MKINPTGKFWNVVVPFVLFVASMAGAWWIARTIWAGESPRWWMFVIALVPVILFKGIWAMIRRYDETHRLSSAGGK